MLLPSLALLAVLALFVSAHLLTLDDGEVHHPLRDVDETGTFNLAGNWVENLTAYGSHSHSINLTMDEGDHLILEFTSFGPAGGIQVRLQHPLHPTDGADGTGGTQVVASTVGENGTLEMTVREPGAYQVYFWNPGAARPPGPGGDPDAHSSAGGSYHLRVERSGRP